MLHFFWDTLYYIYILKSDKLQHSHTPGESVSELDIYDLTKVNVLTNLQQRKPSLLIFDSEFGTNSILIQFEAKH